MNKNIKQYKNQIIKMKKQGYSYGAIAKKLMCSKSVILYHVKNYEEENNFRIKKIKGINSSIDTQNNDDLLNEIITNRDYIIRLHKLLTKKDENNETT
jgi:transposase